MVMDRQAELSADKRLAASFAREELLAQRLLMEGLGDEKRRFLAQEMAEQEVASYLLSEEVIEEEGEEGVDAELETGLAAASTVSARELEEEEGMWWSGSEDEEDVEEEGGRWDERPRPHLTLDYVNDADDMVGTDVDCYEL